MQAVKETAANIAASALSGMEKTKAVIEEKVEIMTTSDPIEKDMATLRKEDRIRLAELRKQEAYNQNAAAAVHGGGPGSPTFTAAGQVHPQKNPFFHNKQQATAVADDVNNNKQGAAAVQSATAKVESPKAMTS